MQRWLNWARRRARAFHTDEGGSSLVTFSLLFPVVLTGILTTVTILQMMVIKSSMASGVYDAAQELIYTGRSYRPSEWRDPNGRVWARAREVVVQRMTAGSFVTQFAEGGEDSTVVRIDPPAVDVRERCANSEARWVDPEQISFTVEARLTLNPAKNIPFLGRLGAFTLVERARAHVECPRGWDGEPIPPRESPLFPGRGG